MCVERACIELLLGKTDQALQQLGLTAQGQQQAGANPTQQAATNYVLVRRPCWRRIRLLVAAAAGVQLCRRLQHQHVVALSPGPLTTCSVSLDSTAVVGGIKQP